ncbi:hypothetical protein JZO70_00670 [Enterococcus sp. 669A]|uniref:Uncharacterized protein n=1 Tax=Candidatus Enterococcus moelleringii TaxID=2815325 RepID=A0ABS3L4Z4_9ENTE|nr:hypothetical protein [Enterococcus sp. 669A]MBO1304655.1 hypothetical protein [Enterococcus sp. 669A]
MDQSKIYETSDSYVDLSIHLPYDAREIGDPLFQFEADYYVEKDLSVAGDDDFCYENVAVFKVIGHTGDFDKDYIYTADAIAESTVENYAFAKGLFEQFFNTEFHNEIIDITGQTINRWLTIETAVAYDEIKNCSEVFQAELFVEFLIKLKQTWKQLFHNDVTLVSFNEGLYVSPEKRAQEKIFEGYQKAEFFTTLNKQEFIEKNGYEHNDSAIELKELFKLDFNNNLFSENIKNPKRKHYSGFIYTSQLISSQT